jgi:hypothetical protein
MIDWGMIIGSTLIFAIALYIYMKYGRKNQRVEEVLQWCWSFFESACKMAGDFVFTLLRGR